MKLRNDSRVPSLNAPMPAFSLPAHLPSPATRPHPARDGRLLYLRDAPARPGLAAAPALTEAVILVKPQFEAGRGNVGKGGIVRDPEHKLAIEKVTNAATQLGWKVIEVIPSPITGTEGNMEFLLYAQSATESLGI